MSSKSITRSITTIEKHGKLILRDEIKPYGLNLAEGLVLVSFFNNERDSITQDKLIDELHFDKGVLTRTMQSLENQGYLKRQSNPNDKRSFIFSITEKSKNLINTLSPVIEKWQKVLLAGLDTNDITLLQNLLEKMAKNTLDKANQRGLK